MMFAMKEFPRAVWLGVAVLLAATKVHSQGAEKVIRLDPALDDIVPSNAHVEKLADHFAFPEGPVWVCNGKDISGYLLFSYIPANVIDRWTLDGKGSTFLRGGLFFALGPSGRATRARRLTHGIG
jgi:gluconolactonase